MSSSADVRAEVVATAQAMERMGLVVATTGNVSVRHEDTIVITPTSLPYASMAPDDVVVLDLTGGVREGHRPPSSEWRLHVALYAARPDLAALVHTHSAHATAWSFLGEDLDTGTEELEQAAGGAVRTAAFGTTGTGEVARAAVEGMRDRRAVLLARHGLVAGAGTLRAALDACAIVERQAQIALLLRGR